MTEASQPDADTVRVSLIEGTTLWTWTRYLRPAGSTDGPVHGVGAQYPFPDSANALGNAKSVNADLTDAAAFTVETG